MNDNYEKEAQNYKLVLLCTESTAVNLERVYTLVKRFINPKKIVVIGNSAVGQYIKNRYSDIAFLDENEMLKGMTLANLKEHINKITEGDIRAIRRAGWYFQQFLKMAYAFRCEEEAYLVWDSDTIPIHRIVMMNEDRYYFDMKAEFHKPYFDTMTRLIPDLSKRNRRSFISEHMIIHKEVMMQLIKEIAENKRVVIEEFWKEILNVIDKDELAKSGFSEFETYGTYVTQRYPQLYMERNWKSLREGTIFFCNGCNKEQLVKLSQRYDAISFESHSMQIYLSHIFSHKVFQNIYFIILFEWIRNKIGYLIGLINDRGNNEI